MTKLTFEIPEIREDELKYSLKAKGHTVHSWFSEQLGLLLEEVSEHSSSESLDLEALKRLDWSFTNDDTSIFTHDIHPYPAKFIPQIPEYLIRGLSERGDTILDPFSGSCTTATEATRLGRNSISIDANPLSTVIGKAKTAILRNPDFKELESLKTHVQSHISAIKSDEESVIYRDIDERFGHVAPEIPNCGKWFETHVFTELTLVRGLILSLESQVAKDVAFVAFSRIIIKVSNQDSETRYTAKQKNINPTDTLQIFLESLKFVIRKVSLRLDEVPLVKTKFLVGDSRDKIADMENSSIDLVVTSPPYANATDYHLYHRFRMFWLGYDPRALGKVEIGSHLKHQRNKSGYEEYKEDMASSLSGIFSVLKPGKFAALVVGDSIFKGEVYETHKLLTDVAIEIGFEHSCTIDRSLHETKRSFVKPGRRLRKEQIVILKKPDINIDLLSSELPYKPFDYEVELFRHEVISLLGKKAEIQSIGKELKISPLKLSTSEIKVLKNLSFSHVLNFSNKLALKTHQSNREFNRESSRKNSTYFTHGLHAYKGKFYPQLAKSLINIATHGENGRTVLDPFCGSGTSVLEAFIGGNRAFGMDINPIAINIAKAKNEILTVNRRLVESSIRTLSDELNSYSSENIYPSEIPEYLWGEVESWFPDKVVNKINFLLSKVRAFGDKKIVNYFELLLSSIVRSISQQDPSDLRIRRRKELINDAPVLELFNKVLKKGEGKLENYWRCYHHGDLNLGSFTIGELDNKDLHSYEKLGLKESSVDCVVTSPPYATALPYIDTDRLSILLINQLRSTERAKLEKSLTGSREINKSDRDRLNKIIIDSSSGLPNQVNEMLKEICISNLEDEKAGFRKLNTAGLLLRYFLDMKEVIENCFTVLKPGASAFFVVGDSRTKVFDSWYHIRTCDCLMLIAEQAGFSVSNFLDVSVTNDNRVNSKNFIEKNSILKFSKPALK